MRLRLLGRFALLFDGAAVTLPKMQRRLVALLGLRRCTNRLQVAGTLWPDVTDTRALSSLRSTLWRLRRLGSPRELVDISDDSIALSSRIRVDVDELVCAARILQVKSDSGGTELLRDTAREELLPGWYEDWVLAERERLRQIRLHALEDLARLELRRHQYGMALEWALAARQLEPLRESPYRVAMEIHLTEGNGYEALLTYHGYRELIRRELGISPSKQMRALLDRTLGLGVPDEAGRTPGQA